MSTAKEVAGAIVKSGLWPDANPNVVLTLCYLAEAEGHHPAVVYRDYHIMSGKPSKKAEAILRDFTAAGGRVEWHVLDDACADATFHHPSGTVRIKWTLDRAKQANLKSPMWQRYPRQMLRSRCISEGVRTVCPAATSGLYEEHEVADIVADTVPDTGAARGQSQEEGAVSPTAPKQPAYSKLKTELRAFVHELEGIGDWDQYCAFRDTREFQRLTAECQEKLPQWWDGGPDMSEEFVPLSRRIEILEANLAAQIAQTATA